MVSPKTLASGKYAFKAFLIQVANHPSSSAPAIQFLHYDKLTDEQKKQASHLVAMVKAKPVQVLNPDTMKAGEVVKRFSKDWAIPQ